MPNLIDEVTKIRGWSGRPRPQIFADTCSINFVFDGAGSALTAPQQRLCQVGFPGRIIQAKIIADAAGAATINLFYGTYTDFPSNLFPIYQLGTIPTLLVSDSYKKALDITSWIKRLQTQDVLLGKLETVSGGITTITLALLMKKYPAGQGWGTRLAVDTSANQLTNAAGDIIGTRT